MLPFSSGPPSAYTAHTRQKLRCGRCYPNRSPPLNDRRAVARGLSYNKLLMGETKQAIRLRYAWAVWVLFGLFAAGRLYIRSGAAGPPLPFASALMLGQVNAHLYFL